MNCSDGESKAAKRNSWVRLWKDMPTDPKFRVVAKRSGRPLSEIIAVFTLMMTAADDNGALDWHADDVAAALDLDPEHVEAIYAAMQGKVLDDNNLTGWRKRQPKREDYSTERVREHRKRRETQCNADETQRNAPDPEKIREELNPLPSEQEAAREAVKAKKFDFGGVGVGLGGDPSVEARRAVARDLNIGDPTPLVDAYRRWGGSRTAKCADAKFRSFAKTKFGNFTPAQRAACQPLTEPEPPIPKSTARPSPQLAALLAKGNRHAH